MKGNDVERLIVRKAAVLGAGVMGAQIAAHLANANVPVVLFDLAAKEGDPKGPNGIVTKALDGLKKLEPAPLATPSAMARITAANYDQHLGLLADCDLIIEAIAERMDWKEALYAKIAPHVPARAMLASNTSGLSINHLASVLPAQLRPRFCGIHFFNPPRYMHLVEIIATEQTQPQMLDDLEAWLTQRLGKGIVRALDTPNFVANRIGVFSMLAVMHQTTAHGLAFDEVDALTGPAIGRPKSATYRTADVVGLDTMANVIKTMQNTLADDPWHAYFQSPAWLSMLIEKGALGQKTRAGVFKKEGKAIHVLDVAAGAYREATGKVADEVAAILKTKDAAEKFRALRASSHPQAQFLWSIFRDLWHYCAVQLEHMADNARDLDQAIRWGFGWKQGPFELWQAAGWAETAKAIAADIAAGKAMASAPLPAWALESSRTGVHSAEGSYSARAGKNIPRRSLPVYERQIFPERLLGETAKVPEKSGSTLFENDGVRLWTLPEVDAGIGILSFKSKMHAVGSEVLAGVLEAIALAETKLDGVVIWHEAPFAVGANLAQVIESCKKGDYDALERMVFNFQKASQSFKYAQIPVVAAVSGMALGGGCEFVMHATKRVMALESYCGLVEAGVGLIPAGGGCKELALQAAEMAAQTATPREVVNFLQPAFMNIAMGKVSKSAIGAIEMGYAKATDTLRFHERELLASAIAEARGLANSGYTPRLPGVQVPVAGRTGIANFEMMLVNMREGGMISAYDYVVARSAAVALCGGEIEAGTLVSEDWLLKVERDQFVALLKNEKTHQRIAYMLENGKPLRN